MTSLFMVCVRLWFSMRLHVKKALRKKRIELVYRSEIWIFSSLCNLVYKVNGRISRWQKRQCTTLGKEYLVYRGKSFRNNLLSYVVSMLELVFL